MRSFDRWPPPPINRRKIGRQVLPSGSRARVICCQVSDEKTIRYISQLCTVKVRSNFQNAQTLKERMKFSSTTNCLLPSG